MVTVVVWVVQRVAICHRLRSLSEFLHTHVRVYYYYYEAEVTKKAL